MQGTPSQTPSQLVFYTSGHFFRFSGRYAAGFSARQQRPADGISGFIGLGGIARMIKGADGLSKRLTLYFNAQPLRLYQSEPFDDPLEALPGGDV